MAPARPPKATGAIRHIGLDFDNTIVSYDAMFHRVALEQGEIPLNLPVSKVAVRDHLRQVGREPVWTAMQGLVYGARMAEAQHYPGVIEFLRRARATGVQVSIISHKTRYPFVGPAYDLHAAARAWLTACLHDEQGWLVDPANAHFELTKEAKWQRIESTGVEVFVDDLPEILLAKAFPAGVRPVLFDPGEAHMLPPLEASLEQVGSWVQLQSLLLP